jgi:thioesterase domain-containing protein/acyl carrier protein
VTSTPLAPYKRKAGSAGTRVVPGVEIMDQAGNLLPAGHAGEIVLCGPNVMQEYRNDPEATRSAFRNGWFRTGDLGRFDDEGYLFVIGRIKEIINRGGEKILPVEIDQALMTHPEVADAAAFAAPHPQLGEDVAAAVVLRPGAVFDEAAIRAFLAPRLAAFKIPRVWMPVSSIPRGASGKVQRSRLVEQYAGLQEARSAGRAAAGPRSEVESKLAEIWETVLGVPVRDVESDFFELGGHSLAAGRVLARIEQTFGVQLGYDALLAAPTIRRQAALLGQPDQRQITAIQPDGSKPPFFMVRPLPVFRPLATRLGKERPFLGLVMPSGEQLAGAGDWADVARQLVSVLRRRQPSGPYHLGGWCADGVLAFEMAQQLTAQGESVALLALFDTPSPAIVRGCPARVALRRRLDMLCWEARFHLASVRQLGRREVPGYLGDRMAAAARRLAAALRALVRPAPPAGDVRAGRHHPSGIRLRISAYDGRPYMGSLTLFRAEGRRWAGSENDPGYGWARWAQGGLTVHPVPGNHLTMFLEPNVQVLARKLSAELARADAAVAMRAGPVIIR